MKIPSIYLALVVAFVSLAPDASAGQFKVLKSFASSGIEGAGPVGNGAVIGGKLYGITESGGTNGKGVLFRINLDGTQFEKIRDFSTAEGSPSSLVGGQDKVLVSTDSIPSRVFVHHTSTSAFSELATPPQNLSFLGVKLCFVDGENFYGVTGINWNGTDDIWNVFKGSLSTGAIQVLYTFSGGADGADPLHVADGGDVIYGVTRKGGALNRGTIFKMKKDGTGFEQLVAFGAEISNLVGDVRTSRSLVVLGNKIYGTARQGGVGSETAGCLYSVNTDGTMYSTLKTFNYDDPLTAPICLATDGNRLYLGMDDYQGGLVSLNANGSSLQTLVTFSYATFSPTGMDPDGMVFSDGKLYGWNHEGGSGGTGTIWFYDPGVSSNPSPYNGPLYGAVTFGGTLFKLQTLSPSIKTSKGTTTTINATKLVATKLSNAIVLERARRAGLLQSASGYSIVHLDDDDGAMDFYAYKPGSLVSLEPVLTMTETGSLRAPVVTDVYNSSNGTSKTSETGTDKMHTGGKFLGMDVAMSRTITYNSADAMINGALQRYYPSTSKGTFSGINADDSEFVEGTISIAAPKAITP